MDKEILERIRKAKQEQKKSIEKHGYFLKGVFDEKGHTIYYTCGLKETFNHLDFDLNLNIPEEIAGSIINTLAQEVVNGKKFKDDMYVNGIIKDFPIYLKKVKGDGRELLRIVFPDPNGLFPMDKHCNPAYKKQLIDTRLN